MSYSDLSAAGFSQNVAKTCFKSSTSVNDRLCHASTRGGFQDALELCGLAVASCCCVHSSLSELRFPSRKATLKVLCFLM